MFEVKGNLWELPADVICITTNGFVKKDGKAVMGRGCAKEAADKMRDLPTILGRKITEGGNHLYQLSRRVISGRPCYLLSFPVKHNWFEEADLELIKRSCDELMRWKVDHNMNIAALNSEMTFPQPLVNFIALPRPGCGNGKLEWPDVKAAIEDRLDNSVGVVTYD